jgi:anti-sigma B factor antagonist
MRLLADMDIAHAHDALPLPHAQRRPFEVEVTHPEGATLVSARGELDIATVPMLQPVLGELTGPVVLDLRGVSFIDASGLRLLLLADARARHDGLDLTLLPGAATERLFQLAGVRDRFSLGTERP